MHQRKYAPYLAEFLWRERFLSLAGLGSSDWRSHAFWVLIDLLVGKHREKMTREITSPLMTVTWEQAAEFDSLRPPKPGRSFGYTLRSAAGVVLDLDDAQDAGMQPAPRVKPEKPEEPERARQSLFYGSVALDDVVSHSA